MAAEPNKTIISDTLYRADGTPVSGTMMISWPAFVTADGKPVASGSLSVKIGSNGSVSIPLVPTEGATPAGTYYKVVISLDAGASAQEYWSVPAVSPTTIAAIRSSVVPTTVAMQVVSRDYVDSAVATAVHKSGDETVGGTKAFASSPLVPSPGTPLAAANKDYVDAAVAAGSGAGIVELNRGGTGQSAWIPARCVRVANDGSKLESAPADCGSGGGGSGGDADTVDGQHATEFLHTTGDESASGAKIFNGGISTKSLNNILFADQFAGGDAAAKINSCWAAAQATGKICDASNITGAQAGSTTIALSGTGTLILGAMTLTSSAVPAMTVSGQASIVARNTQITFTGSGADCIQWTGSRGSISGKLYCSGSTGTRHGLVLQASGTISVLYNNFHGFRASGQTTAGNDCIKLVANNASALVSFNDFYNTECVDFANSIELATTGTVGPTGNHFYGGQFRKIVAGGEGIRISAGGGTHGIRRSYQATSRACI